MSESLVCLHQHLIFSSLVLVDLGETFSKARLYCLKKPAFTKEKLVNWDFEPKFGEIRSRQNFFREKFSAAAQTELSSRTDFRKSRSETRKSSWGKKFRREALETGWGNFSSSSFSFVLRSSSTSTSASSSSMSTFVTLDPSCNKITVAFLTAWHKNRQVSEDI